MPQVMRSGLLLTLALLLSACSDEPGNEDMLQATHANPKFQMMLGLVAGNNPQFRRNPDAAMNEMKRNAVIEKSGCAQAQGAPGYVCDYRWGQRQPDGAVQYGNPLKGRFFKVGNAWAVEFVEDRR